MNGRQLWNTLLLKHQVQPLLWDTTGSSAMILLIQLKGPSINVCQLASFNFALLCSLSLTGDFII